MRTIFSFFIILILIQTQTYSQKKNGIYFTDSNSSDGYVITNRNDTIIGRILHNGETINCLKVYIKDTTDKYKIKYKSSLKDNYFLFKADSCKSYKDAHDYYISYPDKSRNIRVYHDYYFIKLVKQDSLSLYILYIDGNWPQYFIKKPNMEPIYFGGDKFQQMVSAYLSDYPELALKINSKAYKWVMEKDVVQNINQIVDEYNNWKHQGTK